jgi:adenine-specific DNA-methyltransferase
LLFLAVGRTVKFLEASMSANLSAQIHQNLPERSRQLAKLLGLVEPQPFLSFSEPHPISVSDTDCCLLKSDNLEALFNLTSNFSGAIDFCYIDPPYNTGSKFIYNDKRHSTEKGIWGKHAEWMSFMLPRLVLLKDLLSESGIVTISIDDYEYAQLKILLDHIFSEDNHLGTIIVNRSKNGKGSKPHIATNHEYVLVYGKSKKSKVQGLPEQDVASYNKEDEHGLFKVDGLFRKKGAASLRTERPNMFYPLYFDNAGNVFTENPTGTLKEVYPVDSKGVERRWLWGKDKASNESWKLYASPKGVVYVKNYLTLEKRVKVRSLWDSPAYLTDRATTEITKIFGEKVFETPKPLALIEDLIKSCTDKDSIILDFFAGTGTTAHAAHNVNASDQGARKTILVEQNIKIDEEHVAAKKGFRFITDITEFRLSYIANQTAGYKYTTIEF